MADGCGCCSKKTATKEGEPIDEKEVERLAIESILSEAKRGKMRAESFGPSGWQRCRIPRTNKRFLNSLVTDAVSTNKRMKIQQLRREQQKLDDQTDVGDTSRGQKGSPELRQPPREDVIPQNDIHRQKGSSPVKSSDGDEGSDQP